MFGLSLTVSAQTYDEFFLEAICEREKGNHDAAFDLLQHCITLNPNASEAYFYLAQYYGALRNQTQALTYLEKAYELNPENSTYTETLAQAYTNMQQYDKAIGVFEELFSHESDRDDVLAMLF